VGRATEVPALLTRQIGVTRTHKFTKQAQSGIKISQHVVRIANLRPIVPIIPPPCTVVIWLVETGAHRSGIASEADHHQVGTTRLMLKHGLL
jgi:hypothetical protein